MGDDQNGDDESRLVVTSAKKLYSTIQELGVQIDSLSSRCLEVDDLFSNDLLNKRAALKDNCESLFSLSPKAYGAVAREKLWRLALYDAVNRARRIQRDRQWTPIQLDLVKTHLLSGIGVLQLYIKKLKDSCESSTDPVYFRSDNLDIWLDGKATSQEGKVMVHGDREKTWITDLVHLCSINIGDLYRYLRETHSKAQDPQLNFDSTFYLTGACTHYIQAFLLRPESGLAFNQLGNLYCDVNGGLQSVYYLLYSVQSANAYEGAYSNLRQLLDRKIVQFARLPASVEPKPIDTLVNSILSLAYHFLYEHTQLQNYERLCQEALTNFNERLVSCDPELDDKFLFHLSSICVMIVWRLQATNSIHTSAAVAFAISVFCQLVNHLTTVLEQHSRVRTEIPVPLSPSPLPLEMDRVSVASSSKSKTNTNMEVDETTKSSDNADKEVEDDKNGFFVPKRRKCKRRRGSGRSDSESEASDNGTPEFLYSDEEELENSDESEDEWCNSDYEELEYEESIPEEDFDKTSQKDGSEYSYKVKSANKAFDSSSSNGHSDTSGSGGRAKEIAVNKDIEAEIQLSENCAPAGIGEGNEKQKFVVEKEDLMKCRSQVEGVLVALNPFLRWIQASPVIKNALAANAEKAFLEKLCTALNLLVSQNWPAILEDITLGDDIKNDWKKVCQESVDEKRIFKWELEEDRSMLGILQLDEFVNSLHLKPVTAMDALVIRMGRMLAFGSWLVSTEGFSVLYNSEELHYFVATPQTLKAYLLDSKLRRLKDRLGNRRNDELDRLSKAYKEMKINESVEKSHRRIRNRNRRGEDSSSPDGRRSRRRRGDRGRRRRGPPSSDPVYAVIDLEAILKRFIDVKRVASNRKFVVVIPHSAWKTLDMLKDSDEDDSPNARTAFRWLEAALKRRHPGLILQKDQQRLEINFPYPKDPIDVDAWEYYDMMECCNFIIGTWLKNKPRSNEVIWGDVRDKCRVFFLTGQENLVNTKIPRSYDPVKIARNVGIFVDYIVPYPGLGRGKKWKSVAKSNG